MADPEEGHREVEEVKLAAANGSSMLVEGDAMLGNAHPLLGEKSFLLFDEDL